MTSGLAKADYLKKYLAPSTREEGDYEHRRDKKEKKKRKKDRHEHARLQPAGLRIIDDDEVAMAAGSKEIFSEEEEEKPQFDDASASALFAQQQQQQRALPATGHGEGRAPKRTRHDSPDASPPRRGAVRRDSPDASPPRRGAAPSNSHPERGVPHRTTALSAMPPPPPPTADAAAALAAPGLHSNFASQSALAAQKLGGGSEHSATDKMALGAGEATVYRDRDGRKMTAPDQPADAAKPQERVKPVWGSGCVRRECIQAQS